MNQEFVKGCAHCPGGYSISFPLHEDEKFLIVCDAHPLVEGHVLIVTKKHVSCMAALSEEDFSEYIKHYKRVKEFVEANYGSVAVFEHGISGQTVAHAHTHFLPFGKAKVLEDQKILREIPDIPWIRKEFERQGKYIFLENGSNKHLVDTSISYPGFFRVIFGELLGTEERADWRAAHENEKMMQVFKREIAKLKKNWSDAVKKKA